MTVDCTEELAVVPLKYLQNGVVPVLMVMRETRRHRHWRKDDFKFAEGAESDQSRKGEDNMASVTMTEPSNCVDLSLWLPRFSVLISQLGRF